MTERTQRAASLGDLKDIWGLVRNVASDVPFDAGNEAAQECVLSELMACCTSGLSPIAMGEDNRSLALLVGRDNFDWALKRPGPPCLHAAIAPSHQDKGF
jgi:hypothetical protein